MAKNNFDNSNNYGELPANASTTLYPDYHYLDGDGFLYGVGLIAQRVPVKGKDLTPEDSSGLSGGLKWSGTDTGQTLGIKLDKVAGPNYNYSGLILQLSNSSHTGGLKLNIKGDVTTGPQNLFSSGLIVDSDGLRVEPSSLVRALDNNNILTRGIAAYEDTGHFSLGLDGGVAGDGLGFDGSSIFVDAGKGIFIGSVSGEYNKVNINLYTETKPASGSGSSSDENRSGLEFKTGVATTGKSAADLLKIMLDSKKTPGTQDYSNCSGLVINFPESTGQGATAVQYSGGLSINKDSTLKVDENNRLGVRFGQGLKVNESTGVLEVDEDAIVPNLVDGEGTDVVSVQGTNDLKIDLVAPTVTTSGSTTTRTFGGVKVHYSATGSSLWQPYSGYIGVDSSTGEIAVKRMTDTDFGVALAAASRGLIVTPTTGGTNNLRGVEIDLNGKLFVNAPDEHVTNVDYHYSPEGDNSAKLTANASGATAAWSIDVVKGIEILRDAKGHVTGLSVTSGKIPANPNSYRPIASGSSSPTVVPGLESNSLHTLWLKLGSNISITPQSASTGMVPVEFNVPYANNITDGTNWTYGSGVVTVKKGITTSDLNNRGTYTPGKYSEDIIALYGSDTSGVLFTPIASSSGLYGATRLYDSITDGTVDGAATPNAVYDAIATAIADLEAADWSWVILPSLPEPSGSTTWADIYDTYKTKVVLILHSSSTTTGEDIYDEYILMRTGTSPNYIYKWEKIGSTGFVTDNFVQKTDRLTDEEVYDIVEDVFGF